MNDFQYNEMTKMEPNWLRVIDAWRAQPSDPPKVGPSLPFLFGATRHPVGTRPSDRQTAEFDFFRLLDEIANYSYDGGYFTIRPCPNMARHFVISPDSAVDARGGLNFLIGGSNDADSRRIAWDEARDAILSGHYSFYDGDFRNFSAGDLTLIAAALA